jgi:hypothetical protein
MNCRLVVCDRLTLIAPDPLAAKCIRGSRSSQCTHVVEKYHAQHSVLRPLSHLRSLVHRRLHLFGSSSLVEQPADADRINTRGIGMFVRSFDNGRLDRTVVEAKTKVDCEPYSNGLHQRCNSDSDA